jgi:hypothetical protein
MGGPLLFHKGEGKRRLEERRRVEEYTSAKYREKDIARSIKAGTYQFRKKPRYDSISEQTLRDLYINQKLSIKQIAARLNFSHQKIAYWLDKYHITTRTISEAIYVFNHPAGDPFTVRRPANDQEAVLFGLGIGLYWAIGNKANTEAIRLSSTDAKLITKFIDFLKTFFAIPKNDFRFGLQISTDITPRSALDFWTKELKINRKQFYKVTVTKSRSLGTYRHKSRFGVLTVYYLNKKARDILIGLLPL